MFRTPQPQAAISISGDGIAAVGFGGLTGQLSLSVQEVIAFESGSIAPNIMCSNITDPGSVTTALQEVLARYRKRPKRIAMVLPDAIAKVTLLSFDTLPDRDSDLAQLIRLKLQKSAPFSLEEAQLSYIDCGKSPTNQSQLLTVVVHKSVLGEYEKICNDAGLQVGRIDLASFNLINTALFTSRKQQMGDWMLVHAARDYSTVTIVRENQLVFYRTLTAEPSHSLEDFIYQTTMYYEDRLAGNGIEQIVFMTSAIESDSELLEPMFERVFEGSANVIFEQLGKRISVSIDNADSVPIAMLDSLAAPIGILVRDRHN